MTENLLKNDNLEKDILGRLREYAELPQTGFLAGGAVANTILSMEWGGDYPINDLDIFQIESVEGLESEKMPHRYTAMDLFIDGYRGEFNLWVGTDDRRAYVISEARRNGLLNLIDVQFTMDHQNPENYRIMLQGFDLNCCEAGIDLENEKLIYTPNFESFIKTMQLQVNHPCTPFHTAIRITKKKKELQCCCNDDTEFNYLSQIPLILAPPDQNPHRSNTQYAKYFGEKYHNLYLQNQAELDRYFEVILKRKRTTGSSLYTMNPRNSEVIEELKDCYNLNSIKARWELLQGRKGVRDKNIKAWKLGWVPKCFLMVNPKYAQCDWDEKHAKQIENFVGQHHYMGVVFYHFKLNIQEQLKALRVIRRMVNKEGLFVIGLIENALLKYLRNNNQSLLPPNNLITEEWIRSLIDDYLAENYGVLKEPEDFTDFEFSNYITELVTAKDLMLEGIRMHHCVGGYARTIKDGESMIFHIEAEREASTIEISKCGWEGTVSGIYLAQHRGVWNKEPGSFHLMIGKRLFEYLKEKMGIKEDFTTTKSETNDVRERDINSLLARLREGRLRRQGENIEEANNP